MFLMFEFIVQCSTGDISNDPANQYLNPACTCQIINTCESDGQLTIYLNLSASKRTLVNQYVTGLRSALSVKDMTCGALPFGNAPNNYSLGRVCKSDADCNNVKTFPKCSPGISCFCCANLSIPCQTNNDCQSFEKDSLCGCVPGGTGNCGPYFDVKTGKVVLYDVNIGSYPPTIQVGSFHYPIDIQSSSCCPENIQSHNIA
jgi:hypothetical protein